MGEYYLFNKRSKISMMSTLDLKKLELKHKMQLNFDSNTVGLFSRCSYKILDDNNTILVNDNVILVEEVKNKLNELLQEVYGHEKQVRYTSEQSYNHIWLKVREDFKSYLNNGEVLEKVWLADMQIINNQNSITLKAETPFKNDYVKQNYAIILSNCFKHYGFELDYYDHKHLTFVKNN